MNEEVADRIAGCLLGGAVGDAMGAGIEFMSLAEIRRQFGADGVTGYTPAYGRSVAITDDTQMTLFTAEGILRASVRQRGRGICDPPSVVRNAYLRWLRTQGSRAATDESEPDWDGWLFSVRELHHNRAPGNTCLSALLAGGYGTVAEPINNSKGCGGVMRAAPAGFTNSPPDQRFELGCEVAALTHGHPDGYLPAGYLAVAVGALVDGHSIERALDEAEEQLGRASRSGGTLAAVRRGRELGAMGVPTPESLERLGGGWVGDEALAIAISCVFGARTFREGLLAAVNHSGDSDSTGSIAGNLLGAASGAGALPPEWLQPLELREVIEVLAADVALELRGEPDTDGWGGPTPEWFARYPGV